MRRAQDAALQVARFSQKFSYHIRRYLSGSRVRSMAPNHRCLKCFGGNTSELLRSVALSRCWGPAGVPMPSRSRPKIQWMPRIIVAARNPDQRFAPTNTVRSVPTWKAARNRLMPRAAWRARMPALLVTVLTNVIEVGPSLCRSPPCSRN